MANFQRPAWTAASGSAQDNIPGRFNHVIPVESGSTLYCTGSAWGVGAVLVAAGSTGTISGSGGAIDADDIAGSGIIEFGPTEITSTGGTIYALKRNHGVI